MGLRLVGMPDHSQDVREWRAWHPEFLAGLWFLGFVICTVRQVRRIGRHASTGSAGEESTGGAGHGNRRQSPGRSALRPLLALVSRGIGSPFMWFLGRLSLVLAGGVAGRDDVIRTRGVIAHELAHQFTAAIIMWHGSSYSPRSSVVVESALLVRPPTGP